MEDAQEDYQSKENSLLSKLTKNKFIIIGIVAVVLLLTNPGIEQHKAAVKTFVTKILSSAKGSDQQNEEENPFAAIGTAFSSMLINNLVDSSVSSQSLLLFSLTKMTIEGESKVVGVGILGNVFILKDTDDLQEILDKK